MSPDYFIKGMGLWVDRPGPGKGMPMARCPHGLVSFNKGVTQVRAVTHGAWGTATGPPSGPPPRTDLARPPLPGQAGRLRPMAVSWRGGCCIILVEFFKRGGTHLDDPHSSPSFAQPGLVAGHVEPSTSQGRWPGVLEMLLSPCLRDGVLSTSHGMWCPRAQGGAWSRRLCTAQDTGGRPGHGTRLGRAWGTDLITILAPQCTHDGLGHVEGRGWPNSSGWGVFCDGIIHWEHPHAPHSSPWP